LKTTTRKTWVKTVKVKVINRAKNWRKTNQRQSCESCFKN